MRKFLVLMLLVNVAYAGGGFEKPSPFSAEAARKMGALESNVSGSLSTLYNPAGLTKGPKRQVSTDLSIMGGYQQGSNVKTDEQNQSDSSPTLVPGFLGKFNLTDTTAIGLGVYGLAGLNSSYHSNSFKGWDSDLANYSPDNFSRVSLIESSIGIGQQVTKNLSLGASVRSLKAKASFRQSVIGLSSDLGGSGIPDDTPLFANTIELNELKENKFGGVRLGFQYDSDDSKYGIGFVYRSKVQMKTSGNANGEIVYTTTGSALVNATTGFTPTPGQVYQLTSRGSKVSTLLPTQYSTSGHLKVTDSLTVLGGYTLTKYSQIQQLATSGTLTNTLTGENILIPISQLRWKDIT